MTTKKWAAVLVPVLGSYGLIVKNQIDTSTRSKEAWVLPPDVGTEDVSEAGYIFGRRDKVEFSDRRREIIWWVKVPATNQIYACDWESGFSGFNKNDGVILTHKRPGEGEVNDELAPGASGAATLWRGFFTS
jgi:hypothetical protein